MKKKILSILLTVVMILSAMPFTAAESISAASEETLTDSITGVTLKLNDYNNYEIGTADELYAFANLVNAGHSYISVELTSDITVNSRVLDENGNLVSNVSSLRVWTPIGTVSAPFGGIFYGNAYTISGLYCVSDSDYAALFGSTVNSTIDGVCIKDSYFYSNNFAASIASYAVGTTISDCASFATLKGGSCLSGLVSGTSVNILNSGFFG